MSNTKQNFNEIIRNLLIRHEGIRLKPYRCTAGKLTIGIGRNLEDNGITTAEALNLLNNDIESVVASLTSRYAWFPNLNEVRQAVVVDMAFNLGITGFANFKKTIAYLNQADYIRASLEMLNSKWALQVGQRANNLSKMMKNGYL
ncbi:MAG: glycoside hydrolase family protein [Candidatus Cloacimonadales bacterium]